MSPANGSRTRCVAFVGPLPPPVNGFSSICALMLDLSKARTRVAIFDRAPSQKSRLLTLLRHLSRPMKYLLHCIAERDGILYLAVSGGRGQFIDLSYVLIGKLFRRRIFVHHHSFAYINAPSSFNRWFFSLLRTDTHIVLSRKMGESLARVFGMNAAGITVVSNAAFYDAAAGGAQGAEDEAAPLRLGFLSNITFEKGFVEFFAILRRLNEQGIRYEARIAGPVAPTAHGTFYKLLGESSGVEYEGPVYGADKDRFYQQLDIFLFPTNYANEAEPLVVYEAMRRGVYVIACDRGAISEMLSNGAGAAFAADTMVESAARLIKEFNGDRCALRSSRQNSLRQAQRIRTSGRIELEKLMECMRGAA